MLNHSDQCYYLQDTMYTGDFTQTVFRQRPRSVLPLMKDLKGLVRIYFHIVPRQTSSCQKLLVCRSPMEK